MKKIKLLKNQIPTKHDIKHAKKLAKMIDERHPGMKLVGSNKDLKDFIEN